MATVEEVVELDSGVASSEATPESQTTSLVNSKTPTSSAEDKEEEEKPKSDVTDSTTVATKAPERVVATVTTELEDDDDEEDLDETILERIAGLSEMFPTGLRNASTRLVTGSVSTAKGLYDLTRQVVWVAVSTSVILFAPIMFELERLNVEEMMKQDRNRLVLGPGSAMSGPPPVPGMMPAPR
ncbi:translocase of outer mitochondrial membrane 22 homolog mge [Oratosquilla oratoria]|uniref:translocase of outer mitochondrial membrane 22 homolog mge n=1 Tax=Oratosquilla oratoria TaxID=337810 RepID=UPI003F7739D5